MLEGYGIHTLIWDAADERFGEWLVASLADVTGRGIELHVRQGGAAADLTGASVYFLWRHKKTDVRGCEPFEEIDESLGQFMVYYPAAMCEEEDVVDDQCMVSWNNESISTRAFIVHVEPVIIGSTESEDGFTLFVETIKRYDDVIEISSDAADAANEAADYDARNVRPIEAHLGEKAPANQGGRLAHEDRGKNHGPRVGHQLGNRVCRGEGGCDGKRGGDPRKRDMHHDGLDRGKEDEHGGQGSSVRLPVVAERDAALRAVSLLVPRAKEVPPHGELHSKHPRGSRASHHALDAKPESLRGRH